MDKGWRLVLSEGEDGSVWVERSVDDGKGGEVRMMTNRATSAMFGKAPSLILRLMADQIEEMEKGRPL